ncbi:hypothetical protein OCL06_15985 [Alteromonas sp. ASW11-19]|uniref:HTH cro/C1-type domain-containing protein n=1 Tax=Alteromonas salexigens TaxID=2982530 RepID=A0ABT2VS07_9ALTE|nr:hypothetical protein [Alteromonas salexigens]MCU7556092.1 hypothetical protein [Alteromonas salexigens]
MSEGLTNEKIVEKAKKILSVENDNQLAIKLGVSRQQIRQFRQTQRIGVAQLLFTEFLKVIDQQEE